MSVKEFARFCLGAGVIGGLLFSASVFAQQDDPHAMHAKDTDVPSQEHTDDRSAARAMGHATMEHATSNHGDMQMQGGEAPRDARDPHAYSDGYTLTEGSYALPGPRQLKLADGHRFWSLLGDRLEYDADNDVTTFDLQGWYGTTYDRLVIKLEGDAVDGRLAESQTDLLWGHALNAYFDTQLGVRLDQYDEGTGREWLAFGIQGLAPYWIELDLTAYLGEDGPPMARTMRLTAWVAVWRRPNWACDYAMNSHASSRPMSVSSGTAPLAPPPIRRGPMAMQGEIANVF